MSVAKVAASRRNSSLSTGPRTDGGKAASSRNATRHGILSAVPIVAGERTADLEAFDAALRADLRPEGAVESLLADRAIACAWRLRRAARAERDVLERELREARAQARLDRDDGGRPDLGLAVVRDARATGAVERLARYEMSLERSMYRAMHELERRKAARQGVYLSPPTTIDVLVATGTPDA